MPNVKVKENEPFDVALRRFQPFLRKAGVLAEVRNREFYEAHAERKRKAAASVARKCSANSAAAFACTDSAASCIARPTPGFALRDSASPVGEWSEFFIPA